MATDQRYAMNLLAEAKRMRPGEEAVAIIDSCVEKKAGETGTSTNLLNWSAARQKLQNLMAEAINARRPPGIDVDE